MNRSNSYPDSRPRFEQVGHEVRLIPPQQVKAYVSGNKNDYNDARAIAEVETRIEQGSGCLPPRNMTYIHRKLGWLYLLLKRLRVKVPVSELIAPYLARRQ